MKPTTGRIVLYVLSSDDADSINRHFDEGRHGNRVTVGDILPLIICCVSNPELYGGRESINGQVILDAPFSHWVTSVHPCPDQTPGTWHWPQIPPKPGGDSLGRMDAELTLQEHVMLVQLELRIRRLCSHIESLGASTELTAASVEASNSRAVLAAMIEKQALPPYLAAWLNGQPL